MCLSGNGLLNEKTYVELFQIIRNKFSHGNNTATSLIFIISSFPTSASILQTINPKNNKIIERCMMTDIDLIKI